MLTDFRRRVSLYSEWDVRLGPYTRFFGAAAVTNATLAELFGLCSMRLLLSFKTASFLSEVGIVLEQLNSSVAQQVACRSWGRAWVTADLDADIIRSEQSAVEVLLRKLERSNAATHQHVIQQTNRLLERVRRESNIELLFPYGACYSRVLRTTHRKLGRPVDFAVQSDRELIGRTLIYHLREENSLILRSAGS